MKLKNKFTLIVSIFVITLLALTALVAFSQYKKSIKETIAQQQFRMVSALADEIDSKLLTAQQDLIVIAKTTPRDIMKNPEKAQAFLDSKPILHSIFDSHIFLFTPAGKIFVVSPDAPGIRGLDFSFRDYISNTIKTNKPYISDPFFSVVQEKHPVIAFTVPLFDGNGKIKGILAGGVDLRKDNFLGRIGSVKTGETGNLYLYETDGTMIMHTNKARILVKQARGLNRLYDAARDGFEGTGETITSYGMKAVSSFKRLKTKNWILAANSPQDEVYHPIRKAEQYFLIVTITGIIAVFFIISFIMRYLVNPLELFTRHVEELPHKTGDDRFLNIKTKDEIGTLSLAFNKMVTEIDEKLALERSAEKSLRESEARLRESQIIAGLGSYLIDIPAGFYKTSDMLDKLFGIDERFDLSVEGWASLIHPDDRAMMVDYLGEVIVQRRIFDREYRILRHNDRAERWVHGLGKLELDDQGRPLKMHGTIQDITDRKKLEEQLRQSQKLEAIGTLAGGIAHDFNNLLQGLFGYISIAKLNAANKDKSIAALEQAEKALHMSVNLTGQLLTFSKGGKPVKKNIPLQSIIENSVKFALSGSNADYRIKLDSDLWHVEADEGQIGQVIQNIVLNADQAMPMGGAIVITAGNLPALRKRIPHLPEEGKYVEISVKDNGTGISAEHLSKIFDPYFTTKAQGSGLGLATCYAIIKNHGGVIHVASKPGKGTTLYIYLPAVEQEREAVQTAEHSPFVRKGRVLLMDDEELVREIAGKMMEVFGHEVAFAEHGEAAIGKYKAAIESGNPFDIVILDLTIRGGMGGKETIERLLAVDPGIKAIVSSGYSDDAVVSDYRNYGFSARLTKPYKLQELSDTLNNLLG